MILEKQGDSYRAMAYTGGEKFQACWQMATALRGQRALGLSGLLWLANAGIGALLTNRPVEFQAKLSSETKGKRVTMTSRAISSSVVSPRTA